MRIRIRERDLNVFGFNRCFPSAYTLVARITKTKGIKGEVVVLPVDDLPFVLYEGLDVWIVPPLADGVRATQVLGTREHSNGWGVLLKDVPTIDVAARLVGHALLARTDALVLPEHEEESSIGCTVQDVNLGDLGTITRIEATAAHPIWVITGVFGEVMLPVVDEFIVAIEGDLIRVNAPQGLIDDSTSPRSRH